MQGNPIKLTDAEAGELIGAEICLCERAFWCSSRARLGKSYRLRYEILSNEKPPLLSLLFAALSLQPASETTKL